MKRDKSIVQKDLSKCWVCGTSYDIHIHEIFFGTANRKKSIKYGLYVGLCGRHHNMSDVGVHNNLALNLELKRLGQKKFEELYSHEEFIRQFGKSYL